jgi:hypothetical protein
VVVVSVGAAVVVVSVGAAVVVVSTGAAVVVSTGAAVVIAGAVSSGTLPAVSAESVGTLHDVITVTSRSVKHFMVILNNRLCI